MVIGEFGSKDPGAKNTAASLQAACGTIKVQ